MTHWYVFAIIAIRRRSLITAFLQNPSEPAASQTASYLSWAFYDFLDSIVYKAFKNKNLEFSDLPVLADDDKAKYLAETAFPVRTLLIFSLHLLNRDGQTIDPVALGRKRGLVISILIHFSRCDDLLTSNIDKLHQENNMR